jgi:hypothetical protein
MIAADATIHIVKVLTALFPSPTGWLHADDQVEPEPGEDSEPEPDWEPDPEDLVSYLVDMDDEDDGDPW